ncbi:hypothetical protein ACIRON_15660 [Nocardioides sp. NPDC101246]|uniref:hypothetical protein n=1 Tax=Nocardioides sp. NPDC101246 TaxID=3364336 RepID=UPI0037F8E0BC
MDNEIELISDENGIALIGDQKALEAFLASENLPPKEVPMPRLGSVLSAGSATAETASQIASQSGRWVQLTKDSAKLVDKYGLRQSSKSQLSTGVLKGSKGQIKGFVEFSKTPGQMLRNPAILTGAAGIMAQLAMQQTMEEITDYLARIDAKVDDILRAQKDAVIADMLGVDLVIDEAMTIRAEVGRVSDITWSKAQNVSMVIAKTQAYALRQLDAIAEKLERETKVSELAKLTREAEAGVRDWLAVLAHCFRLADGISVLELERVLDADPDDLDQHRIGVQTARRNRMALIARTTEQLLTRMDAAARAANGKVLLNPGSAKDVVRDRNTVATSVTDFHSLLGLDRSNDDVAARRWLDAAGDVRDRALERGADARDTIRERGSDGIDNAKRLGADAADRAKRAKDKLAGRLSERPLPRRSRKDDA